VDPFLGLNLGLRFVLEIAMLVALGWTGAELSSSLPFSIALAVLLPLVAAGTWGALVAPKAPRRLPDPARLLVELVLFGAAAAGLVHSGHPVLAAALAVVAGCNIAVLRLSGAEH
jgi:hypothetical protein